MRINVKIYSMTDCGEAISLTFLSNDWLIGKNCVLLTLCNNKNFLKNNEILHPVWRNYIKLPQLIKLQNEILGCRYNFTRTFKDIYRVIHLCGQSKRNQRDHEKLKVTHSNYFRCHLCWMSGILQKQESFRSFYKTITTVAFKSILFLWVKFSFTCLKGQKGEKGKQSVSQQLGHIRKRGITKAEVWFGAAAMLWQYLGSGFRCKQ